MFKIWISLRIWRSNLSSVWQEFFTQRNENVENMLRNICKFVYKKLKYEQFEDITKRSS
jgi:hypothetical protein